jgi:tellurite resistance protein
LEAVGVSDEGILQTLEELGFNRDTVRVFHLFPLVVVAWADGVVSENERAKILEAARAWDITEEQPSYARLKEWLDVRPDEVTTSRALRVMRDVLQFRPVEKQQDYRKSVITLCEQVAEASGGFLGIYGKVSREERAIIKRVAGELAVRHRKAAEEVLAES